MNEVKFSPRELEVLQYIVDAKTYRQMAQSMGISERTVKTYVGNIRRKTGRCTIASAVALAVNLNMVKVKPDL